MRILLSPAKKMRQDRQWLLPRQLPEQLEQTRRILARLSAMDFSQLKQLWGCSEAIARQNLQRLQEMDLEQELTPAILAYDGLAFQYMAPSVMEADSLAYLQAHLRILSGFYGVLRPLDGVRPYRLEMQAPLDVDGAGNLYEFWGRRLYEQARSPRGCLINLASREYFRCIEPWLTPEDRCVSCVFAQLVRGKPVQKSTFAKMARGEMVRYLAEIQAREPEQMTAFDRLGFSFRPELSSPQEYVFIRQPEA